LAHFNDILSLVYFPTNFVTRSGITGQKSTTKNQAIRLAKVADENRQRIRKCIEIREDGGRISTENIVLVSRVTIRPGFPRHVRFLGLCPGF